MNTTRVNKWGNSQGVILPKHLCEHVGIQVGDLLEVTVDAFSGTIELSLAPEGAARDAAPTRPSRA